MSVSITGIRFSLVILSLFGYSIFFCKRWKIPVYAAPLFSISMITVVTYFCGLLNVLQYSSYMIMGLGFLLLIIEVCQLKVRSLRSIEVINSLNFMLLIGFILFSISLIDLHLIHYDNFSHWAVVVKEMVVKDAFPTAKSVLIDFKNYPLGTSSWIYYVCKMAGMTEGIMLAAQGTMIYAAILSVFCVIRDRKRLLLSAIISVCAGVMTVFNISIRVDNLLVDFVLPLVALGSIAIIYYYRDNLTRCCIAITPILSMLLLIKNNAVFFVLPCAIYLFYCALRTTNRFHNCMMALLCIVISLSVFFSWSYHTKTEFKDAKLKFDVTQDGTESQTMKSDSEITLILNEFIKHVFTTDNQFTVGFLVINIVALLIHYIGRKYTTSKWNLLLMLVTMDLTYILYHAGILLMYIFMMPMEEAVYLAGFERYTSSIMFFLLGVLTMTVVVDVENAFHVQQRRERNVYAFKSLQTKKIYLYSTIILSSIGCMLLMSDINGMKYVNKQYSDTLPGKAAHVMGNTMTPDNPSSYAIYATDTDSQVSNYYLGYIARYMLLTDNIYVFSDLKNDEIVNSIENYDYLVVVEELEHDDSKLLPGIYDIHELLAR